MDRRARLRFDHLVLPFPTFANWYNLVTMPLWSNEEWRARIGSCWCALGRPGKSAAMSGNHQSYNRLIVLLSGRTMLQAVYVLLTLILVQGVKSINERVTGCRTRLSESMTYGSLSYTVTNFNIECVTFCCNFY